MGGGPIAIDVDRSNCSLTVVGMELCALRIRFEAVTSDAMVASCHTPRRHTYSRLSATPAQSAIAARLVSRAHVIIDFAPIHSIFYHSTGKAMAPAPNTHVDGTGGEREAPAVHAVACARTHSLITGESPPSHCHDDFTVLFLSRSRSRSLSSSLSSPLSALCIWRIEKGKYANLFRGALTNGAGALHNTKIRGSPASQTDSQPADGRARVWRVCVCSSAPSALVRARRTKYKH